MSQHSAPILLTGFEPFGGDTRNPSADIARALDGHVIARRRVVGAVLPCAFRRSAATLRRLIARHRPNVVICLGLASNRMEITPERVAINVDDARICDNAGRKPVDRAILARGPAAYWSTLPIKAIVAALAKRRIPASVSQTAGTFVCNHVFYSLMHELRRKRKIRAGFIHVPWPVDWPAAGSSSLTLEQMTEAIGIAIETTLRTRRDLRHGGGKIA